MKTSFLFNRVRQVKTTTRFNVIYMPTKLAVIFPGHARSKLRLYPHLQI